MRSIPIGFFFFLNGEAFYLFDIWPSVPTLIFFLHSFPSVVSDMYRLLLSCISTQLCQQEAATCNLTRRPRHIRETRTRTENAPTCRYKILTRRRSQSGSSVQCMVAAPCTCNVSLLLNTARDHSPRALRSVFQDVKIYLLFFFLASKMIRGGPSSQVV